METRKKLLSWLKKQGYAEAQALAYLKGLTPPFHQTTNTGILGKLEDYPLLVNLYELRDQGKIIQTRLLPNWVRDNIEQIIKMSKVQDKNSADWRKLVWSVYWFTKFSGYELVNLAVAKIRAKWHTGDRPEAFFEKLEEQEEKIIKELFKAGYPDEGLKYPESEARRNARFVGCSDDRDRDLNSEDENRGYGLPKEDFEKDMRQLAYLLGGSTSQRNLTWVGLAISFIWPEAASGFHEVPLDTPRVSTTAEGVTITLSSVFFSEDWLKNPLLWERIKLAIKGRFGFYERVPPISKMEKYLDDHKDVDDSSARVADEYHKRFLNGIDDKESAHKQMRYRAKIHPLLRM